jgi:AraC-like DNA-binding protein
MLREDRFTIAEIAGLLTFDTSNFTKFFKRFEGITPSAYRHRLQEAEATPSEMLTV